MSSTININNFYQSKQWRGLIDQLKLERLNEQGELICEYCGKAITKKYDCIGHHVVELTEDNINDYSTSLNPNNIQLIHFRCHNLIHQRYEGYKRIVYLVYGAPCSGKRDWVKEVANKDDLILDIDSIWDCISIAGKKDKQPRLKSNVFGIRDFIIDQIRTRTGNWRNAYIIGGYPLRTDRDRLCELLSAKPIYIQSTEEECMGRASDEKMKQYIADWFEDFIE